MHAVQHASNKTTKQKDYTEHPYNYAENPPLHYARPKIALKHSEAIIGASQMTTKYLTIKLVKFPNFIVMEFHKKKKKKQRFGTIFRKISPPQPPPKRKCY